jgi:thiol-disulfide isomerase/thioredoxin
MVERLLIIIVVVLLVIAARMLLRSWQQRNLARAQRAPLPPELAEQLNVGQPAVLAFSSPGCAECRSRQMPALEQLRTRLNDSTSIIKLSAPDHPALVNHFGILTVPATVVLDANGEVRHVNLRYASADHLHAQVRNLVASSQG